MLDYIRKRSGGIIGFLIIGAIALVFVFWGVGGQNTGEISNIVMDDEKIPVQYYLELKRDAMEQLRSQGEGIDPDILNQAAAQRALSNLTQRHVLRKLAAGTGRSIPEQELVRQITSQPAFQDENGVFRKSLYEQYVSQATNFSVATFEQRFADDLLVTSTADFVYGLAFTPTKELDERYHLTEDQVKLNYAYFPVASFTEGLEPTEEETKDYYERNKEAFRRPAELRADYVTVEPNSFLDGVEVTDEEISAQYEEERSRLTSQPSAEVRHILFRFPSFYPSAEDKAAVLKKADDAMARLATEDFATLARELSEDPATAPKGGDLGTLRKGATVKEFEDAVYGLGAANVGKPIGPIETNFGYHIILVESYTPPKTTPLEVAKPELEREIRERKARRAAVDRIEDLYDRVQRDPSLGLRQVADALGLEVRGSEFFTAADPPDWLPDPMEAQRAMAAPLGQSSAPVDIAETPDSPERLVVYQPTERRESVIPGLDDAGTLEAAKKGWREEAASKLALKEAEECVAQTKKLGFSMGLDKLRKDRMESGTTDFFPRASLSMAKPPVSEADTTQLFEAMFRLTKTGDVVDKPITVRLPDDGGEGFVVLGLADQRPADQAPFEENVSRRRDQAMESRSQAAFSMWVGTALQSVDLRLPKEVQEDASNQRQLY